MHHVLLATDGSKASLQAARLLAHLPHPDRLDLTVLSVVQRPFIHSSYSTAELLEKAYRRDKQFAVDTYQTIFAMFDGANASLRHELCDGPVGEKIVETAAKTNADLVILGAKGHSQIGRLLLGSVSDHVATHAPCSTLVVRATGLQESNRPIRVCLAYENSESATAALEEISEIPWRTGTEFHLLTVETYLSDFIGQRIADEELNLTARYETDLMQAKERLSDVAPGAQPHLVKADHIGEGIVSFAESNGIDLLIIGETPRSAVNRFLLGSTSRYVLRHAPCSVWVTRNRVTGQTTDAT
ncbi:universal stress protein [Stieleria sp. TO1_6]|uniref:universal stress protein n=1 Tax=Stieleria tagensis TaxID=2956795 RepID=UPI00209A90F4|nr:universal stress protein [Stieleria tagensis]MCO8122091.1 universal stress protein [Stieleria tagensis]